MLAYRVFFHDPAAASGSPGHPLYLHKPQGAGRWDNPDLYDAWYLSTSAEGAVGEAFGNLGGWNAAMFDTGTPGLRRALAVFSVPDDLAVFDFDDPANLVSVGMRPSQVVLRNKPVTQRRAAALFEESGPGGGRRWQALQWWSYHHPRWTNLMLWSTPTTPAPLSLKAVEELGLDSPAVQEAAEVLMRPLPVSARGRRRGRG